MRLTHILVPFTALVAAHVVVGCSDAVDTNDCHTYSMCPAGGSSTAGSGGNTSEAGAETGGSSSGKAGMSGASGKGGNTSGGSSSSGGAGEGGIEGGVGGMPIMLPCDGACAGTKPVCKESTDTCVQCLMPTDCTSGAKTKCDTTSNSCVECLASADCSDAKAGKCDKGACGKCTSNDDCAHLAGKTVCDTVAGECVQCTVSDESACAGNSCHPATRACTTTPVGKIDYCKPCVADSECFGGNKADPDARCVPMTFNAVPRTGGFCLRRFAKTCAKPYFKMSSDRQSLSGTVAEAYCGIDESSTRCEAVLDFVGGEPCADGKDSSCGCSARDGDQKCIDVGSGGLCQTVLGVAKTCTIPCSGAVQCTTVTTCTGGQPYCH